MQQSSKILTVLLWLAQLLLASSLVWAGSIKLFQTPDKLALLWPWAGQVPVSLVKITGVVDLLGGLGLVLPTLLRIKQVLTPITAIAVILLMIVASAFHIFRGEASSISANIFFAALAAFIAWGRLKKS